MLLDRLVLNCFFFSVPSCDNHAGRGEDFGIEKVEHCVVLC